MGTHAHAGIGAASDRRRVHIRERDRSWWPRRFAAAGWILPQPLQLPTIWVLAVPVVVIVPLPFVLTAELELELTNTPQPLVRLGVPLISSELGAVGIQGDDTAAGARLARAGAGSRGDRRVAESEHSREELRNAFGDPRDHPIGDRDARSGRGGADTGLERDFLPAGGDKPVFFRVQAAVFNVVRRGGGRVRGTGVLGGVTRDVRGRARGALRSSKRKPLGRGRRAAASAAVCAACLRKFAQPISTTRPSMPNRGTTAKVNMMAVWPLRFPVCSVIAASKEDLFA